MVVLKELAKCNQYVTEKDYAFGLFLKLVSLFTSEYLFNCSISKKDRRAFDCVYWGYYGAFTRTLRSDVSPGSQELVNQEHCSRMYAHPSQSCVARSAIS